MCGIAGIIGTSKVTITIETLLQRIRHRGPDGLFYWKEDDKAFGHARLSIIDLSSNGNQPMIDPATGNVIIFNGDIYNYLELKKAIGQRYTFHTGSDTEVILAAYVVYGIDFLKHLRGMFAFALFDKAKNKTLLVRDRFGIKPLYYRNLQGAFLFGSEIKAIINLTAKPEALNEFKVYEFLGNCQMDTNEQTLFNNIYQLSPAHYAWINATGKMENVTEYWAFPQPGKRHFDEKAGEELVELFDETIRLHLRSDVPVGSFLSGGIDSSSVTCFALKNMQQSALHTFSAVLPYFHPENALINDVLDTSDRIIPHTFLLSGEKFFDDIPDLIYQHDEPTMDGSMYAHYKLCEMAKANKIKVLLSGSGGDELFGGYASHIHAQHAKLFSQLRFGKYFRDIKKVSKNSAITYKNLLVKSLYENIPVRIRQQIKKRQIQRKIGHLTIRPAFPHYYHNHPDPYFANLINNYKSWTAPPFLHYEDRNSMAFGVETRVPFFDHVLIEFILQFTTEDIIQGKSKSILRNSFKGIVPEIVLQQKGKYGFPSPIDHALKHDQETKDFFNDTFAQTPLLKPKETAALGNAFYHASGDVSIFWRTFSYMIWYQVYFKHWKGYLK
jgi:asparagine synthase (glutamine-hydrolysing)